MLATSQAVPRWLLRALVYPFALFMLTLGLSFNGPAAQAYVDGTLPVKIGTLLKSPPARMLAVGVGTGPIGVGLAAASVGLLAYQTKDSWWPVLDGWLNKGGTAAEGTASSTYISGTIRLSTVDVAGLKVDWSLTRGGSNLSVQHEKAQCRSASGGSTATVPNGALVIATNVGPSFSKTSGTVDPALICGSGETLTGGRFRLYASPFGEQHYTAWTVITSPWPAEQTVQKSTVVCRATDGTYSAISETMTGFADRVAIPSCADRVPGSIPWSGTIQAGPSATALRDVQTFQTKQDVFDEYADCFGPTGLQCVIKVWVDGQPCTVGDVACGAWPKIEVDDPARVQCKFGTHVVSIRDCHALKKAYRTDTEVQEITKTNPDGSPHYPAVDPVPSTGTGTGTTPMPTEGTNPTTDPSPDGQSCLGAAWSWNPIDWVYVPVKCAMVWTFKPDPGYADAKATALKTKLDGTAPMKYAAAFDDLSIGAGPQGCEGIPFKAPIPGAESVGTVYIGEACSGKMAEVAGLFRLGTSAVVVIYGGWACVRVLLGGFGVRPEFNPDGSVMVKAT